MGELYFDQNKGIGDYYLEGGFDFEIHGQILQIFKIWKKI